MASYFHTFEWSDNQEHPAGVVYVTGTFDNWSKTERLEWTRDGILAKRVKLNLTDDQEKILFKFVVDGDWRTDPRAPIDTDADGNQNNVIFKSQLEPEHKPEPEVSETPAKEPEPELTTLPVEQEASEPKKDEENVVDNGVISSAASGATSAELAGLVPLEREDDLPAHAKEATTSSAAPEATTALLAAQVPKEQDVSEEEVANVLQSSAAPESTTAHLAGQVPKEEPKVETPNEEATKEEEPKDETPKEEATKEEEAPQAAVVTEEIPKEDVANILTSSAGPESSTAQLAAQVPKENATLGVPEPAHNATAVSSSAASFRSAASTKDETTFHNAEETTPSTPKPLQPDVNATATSNGSGTRDVITQDVSVDAPANGTSTQPEPKTAAPVQPQPVHTSISSSKKSSLEEVQAPSPADSTKQKKRRSLFGRIGVKLHLW